MAEEEHINPVKAFFMRVRELLHSSRGKDVLIFLLFTLVSYIFWVIMSLNDDGQRDLEVKLEITDVPEDVIFISEVPKTLQVNVRDKGTVLAGFYWNGTPALKLRYNELTSYPLKDRVAFPEQELASRVRSLFASTSQIVSVRPDSLSLIITDRPGTRAIVIPDLQIEPSPQSVISGPVKISPDTVTVYTARHLAARPTTVKTMTLSRSGLTDTLVCEVRIRPESGVRFVPDRVTVTIPVEPLISKTRVVPVTLLHGTSVSSHEVVLFPSQVSVSYLLPMSLYSTENSVITVNADFYNRSGTKIPLSLGSYPDYYQDISLSQDSVEYLIEQKAAFTAHENEQ